MTRRPMEFQRPPWSIAPVESKMGRRASAMRYASTVRQAGRRRVCRELVRARNFSVRVEAGGKTFQGMLWEPGGYGGLQLSDCMNCGAESKNFGNRFRCDHQPPLDQYSSLYSSDEPNLRSYFFAVRFPVSQSWWSALLPSLQPAHIVL